MIKEAFSQGNIQYLLKLFSTYEEIHDENEILKVGGKIIQKSEKFNDKSKIIKIFDNFYQIISKQRSVYRGVYEMELIEERNGNRRKVKYLREYKDHLSSTLSEMLKKLIKDIKKGISSVENRNVNMPIY